MNMYFSARTQTLAQFKEVYDKRLLNETPKNDSPVIFCAMANQTPQNRYDIVKFLIGEGAELKGTNDESATLFHILFSLPQAQYGADSRADADFDRGRGRHQSVGRKEQSGYSVPYQPSEVYRRGFCAVV